jgi:hypothetical protein
VLGPEVWTRFKGGRVGSVWYQHTLLQALREKAAAPSETRITSEVIGELERAFDEFVAAASG